MAEVRIDPLGGQRVIVGDGAPPRDVFAAAGERPTNGGLSEPRFAAVLDPASPEPEPTAYPDLFWAGAAAGTHELIDGGDAVRSLGELSPERLETVFESWRSRMRAHADAACLHLFADESVATRATAQLLSLPFVPALIARERERFRGYATRTMGGNLLGDLLQQEVRLRSRLVAVDSETVLLSAYAARVPYQLMVVPRTPRMRFEDDGPSGEELLAGALARLARRLDGAEVELWVRTAPQGAEHFCWRIDIAPQLPSPGGGLEHGTGVAVNPVAPELAAAELRDIQGP